MPFFLLIVGLMLITVAVRNTQDVFVTLISSDFSGPGNFLYWVAALLLFGLVGYVPKLKPVSDGFLVLILLALVLSRGNPKFNAQGGFFGQLQSALKGTTKGAPGSSATAGGSNLLPGGGVDLGLGGAPVRVDFPGYNAGLQPGPGSFGYYPSDPSEPVDRDDVLCRMDPSCQYGRY